MARCTAIALAVCAASLLAGCGLEDYEARMTVRLAELQEMTRYESLYGTTPITLVDDESVPPYPITIRLPRAFKADDWFRVDSAYRNESKAVEPHVLYPPFLLEFPGFNRVGEAFAEATPQTHFSFYCYLGVLDSRAAKFETVLADLRKKTAAKLPQTGPWQDVECRDENLAATKWKMFEAKGKQKFAQKSGPSEATLDAMGTFRVYAREDQGYIILWAVRMPDELNGKVYLLDLADAVAGTVKVTEPAPTGPYVPPKPKPKAPDEEMPTEETTDGETPATETPGEETPAAEKPVAKPPAGQAPVEEEEWSSEKNDQAPPEEPATDQPPAEEANPADAAPDEAPEATPMEESGAENGDEQPS